MDLKESQILGNDISKHWYYVSKLNVVKKIIGSVAFVRLLDVGAGSAYFSKSLLETHDVKEVCCVDTSYETEYEGKVNGKIIKYLKSINSYEADFVLMMDVIEHVDNDVGLIKEYIDKVPIGCNFLISVPAFQWLWSCHDDFLDHKRRYSISQLEETVSKSGLEIINSQYFYGGVFPIAVILRLFERLKDKKEKQSQLKRHSKIINNLLLTICKFETKFFINRNKLFGLTVFCLAKKV